MDELPLTDLASLKRSVANDSLIDYTQMVLPWYKVIWFHNLLANRIQRLFFGDIKFLIIEVPPQNGKSTMISEVAISWAFGKNPNLKICNTSYSSTKAEDYNRHTQEIMKSPEYKELFPHINLSKSSAGADDKKAKQTNDYFEIQGYNGYYKTVGIGGPLTGFTADIMGFDDIVKDSLEASSYVYRQRHWEWWNDVALTRCHNDTRKFGCMTRWDDDDLVGRIKKASKLSGEEIHVLTLPAIKETDLNPEDPRAIGEALWEEKHSLKSIRAVQKESPRTYAALYQQNPRPGEVGGEAYYGFKADKHVQDVKYNPNLPLHITWDFNRFPYTTCLVWQFEQNSEYMEARCIDEFCPPDPARTKGTCERFLNRYFHSLAHVAGLFVYGDPSGRNESTTTEEGVNNYTLIEQYLEPMHPQMRVASTQPSVDMRINWLNDVFENNYGKIKILVNPICINTINDYQFIKLDPGPKGGKLKEKGMVAGVDKPCEIYGHTSDAGDYILCEIFREEYLRFQRGGNAAPVSSGRSISPKRRIY